MAVIDPERAIAMTDQLSNVNADIGSRLTRNIAAYLLASDNERLLMRMRVVDANWRDGG
jgi:hypothetical protein